MPEHTAKALAGIVQGDVQGDSAKTVSGVADLKSAQSQHVSFLANQKYIAVARQTQAGVVLVGRDAPLDFHFTQIRVDSPSLAFSKVIALFAPEPLRYSPGIHSTAVVAPNVRLGQGVSVQPHVVIESGAVIGDRTVLGAGSFIGQETVIGEECFIHANVSIRERTRMGNRVIVHCGAVIGSDGFGYEFQGGRHVKIPQVGFVQIDDDVEIGANTTIDRGRFDRTWIQEGSKIDNLVMIAHNVAIGKHAIVVSQTGISGSSSLGNYVTLAGQVGLVGHIHIGDRAVVTAQSGVAKDVPAGEVYSGTHARPLRERLKGEAMVNKLPELVKRIQALEEKLKI